MAVMQISRKVDYALRAVIYLAMRSDRRPCAVTEIAAREGIPKKFLEKIIQDLIHHGPGAPRGAQGGYTLARMPRRSRSRTGSRPSRPGIRERLCRRRRRGQRLHVPQLRDAAVWRGPRRSWTRCERRSPTSARRRAAEGLVVAGDRGDWHRARPSKGTSDREGDTTMKTHHNG
jgi:hypothetical protein